MIRKFNDQNIYLFFLFYFSLIIASPLLINFSLLLIGIISIYYFDIKLFRKTEILIFLIFIFTILLSTSLSKLDFEDKLSSLSWFKFFLLFIFMFLLNSNFNEHKFKKILKFFLYLIYLLIFDIFFQRILGYDLFGYELIGGRSTGPYGDELIPGGIILFIGFVPFFLKLQEYIFKKKIVKSIVISNIFFVSIFVTGERMNTILSFFAIFIIIFVLFKYKKFLITFLIVYFLSILLISSNYKYKEEKYFTTRFEGILLYLNLPDKFNNKVTKSKNLNLKSLENTSFDSNFKKTIFDSPWGAHYLTAYEIWKDNRFIGAGNKSFRYDCAKYDFIKSKSKDVRCSSHPHNIYLEILSEFGLIGFVFFLLLNLIILYKSSIQLKNYYKIKKNNNYNYRLLISVFIVFILLIWPLKSTGRISSTFYGSIYWFYIFFLSTLNYRIKNILNNKN